MARVSTDDKHYKAIAQAIRTEACSDELLLNGKFKPAEMSSAVTALADDNYSAGYEEGKQAEYDAFWDAYQENGNRAICNHMFAGKAWNADTFKPKYDIKPINAYMIFRECGVSGDLVEILDALGIELDFSKAADGQMAFSVAPFTRVGVINLSNFTGNSSQANYLFMSANKLVTIDRLILPTTRLNLTDAFSGCSALKNLTIEGTIQYNFNVQSCPLTHDSLMSIINALKDGASYTLTIGETNYAKLTEDEIAIAEQKGWTVA